MVAGRDGIGEQEAFTLKFAAKHVHGPLLGLLATTKIVVARNPPVAFSREFENEFAIARGVANAISKGVTEVIVELIQRQVTDQNCGLVLLVTVLEQFIN